MTNPIHKYVVGNEININEKEWNSLIGEFTKEELVTYINDTIDDFNIKFPFEPPLLDEAIADFHKLKSTSFKYLLKKGEFFSRYDYTYSYNNLYFDVNNTGAKSSNYFHFHNRMKCDSINSPSPTRSWESYKFRNGAIKALFSLKMKQINSKSFATAITMRKYVASQFKPAVAKAIYETFNSEYVLDFSSGWGDRLSGFLATPNTKLYVGIDPNTSLHSGYKSQVELFNTDKKVNMYPHPAEDHIYDNNIKFDTIFTSPPYFNIEKYDKGDYQSHKRYKKIDIWREEFLFKTIEKAWPHLKDGGILIVNISDVYSGHRVNDICDPMNDFISKLDGAHYLGGIGYRMQKRQNSKSDKSGIFCEPMWVFGKNRTHLLS